MKPMRTREPLPPVLCLASASPRRRELLEQIGVPHLVQPADLDETRRGGESPEAYVLRLARAKAEAIFKVRRDASALPLPVLGADTTVSIENELLGKPVDETDLLEMFVRLSGREHEVWSAVALVSARGTTSCSVCTRVRFRVVEPVEARRYWASGEPCDKAGGYAIQGYGAVFVERIEGSYSGVVGLPLAETAALLFSAGIPLWHSGT